MGNSEITAVADEFGLGPVEAVTRPSTGSMNEIFLLGLGHRDVVLRKHRRTERSQIEHEHEIMDFARQRGIPVPDALPTVGGDRFIQRQGCWYSVFAYAAGRQLEAADLDPAKARAMGVMLARIQAALLDCPGPQSNHARSRPTAESTLQRVAQLKAAITARAELTEQDRDALDYLDSQVQALQRSEIPPAPNVAEPVQMIHGDYQHNNLFFDGDDVCAVIDWDKAEVAAPGQEIVRTMDLSLRLQPLLCRAFIDGYRAVRDLADATLDAAAEEYGFGQLHGLWVHETFYLRGDGRVRQFLTPPPFVPFAQRWARLH